MSSDTSADLLGQYRDFLTSSPSRSDRKILKATLDFIKREQLELDRQTLGGFLDSDPPREISAGILPLDGLTERLELIAKMEDRIRVVVGRQDYRFDDYGFAALLVAPLPVLRSANDLSWSGYSAIKLIKVTLDNVYELVHLCQDWRCCVCGSFCICGSFCVCASFYVYASFSQKTQEYSQVCRSAPKTVQEGRGSQIYSGDS
ncbi:hypothetical protein B0H67DRAFT_136256 [Lasiosphaeris hirsuta]|uniref:Uncharacterized protein n=1 Tax=Lasiosphaeris hirsuta TaxID=260670 RepID=A0AA40E5C0_9PEZI|nr:hypothetical protein B0H67DRAFT_136256 [Lasiosphaeris hirsuta]